MVRTHRVRLHVEQLEDRCVPATFTVTKLTDGTGVPGLTLREAVEAANDTVAPDKIVFKNTLAGTILLGSSLTISESLTISGPSADRIIISGGGTTDVLFLLWNAASTVAIRKVSLTQAEQAISSGANLTLANAKVFGNSAVSFDTAGVESFGSQLTITGCLFFDNSAYNGGAILAGSGTVKITDSSFSENRASLGGAIEVSGTSITTMERCRLTGNSAEGGGAIFTHGGTLTLNACTVSGNAANDGGGLDCGGGGTVEIRNSTIAQNVAYFHGGGIYVDGPTVTVRNSTISGNRSGDQGGGIAIVSSSLLVQNSTIVGNGTASTGSGGGIWAGSPVTLQSTIVARNFSPNNFVPQFASVDAADTFTIQNSLIDNTTGANLVQVGANQLNVNPLLGPLASNGGLTQTHALLAGSPAINNGSNFSGFLTDQRGGKFMRIKGGFADIGAFELK